MTEKPFLDPEKLRNYRLRTGAHKLKNRSSKDILRLGHCNAINIYRSLSGAALLEMSLNGNFEARVEIDRRRKKAEKKGKQASV